MGWKVIISSDAEGDLEEIVTFIARDNPAAGFDFGNELIDRALAIAAFPEAGPVVREFGWRHLREVIHKSYRIVYRVDFAQERIEIVRFWHAARGNPPH